MESIEIKSTSSRAFGSAMEDNQQSEFVRKESSYSLPGSWKISSPPWEMPEKFTLFVVSTVDGTRFQWIPESNMTEEIVASFEKANDKNSDVYTIADDDPINNVLDDGFFVLDSYLLCKSKGKIVNRVYAYTFV